MNGKLWVLVVTLVLVGGSMASGQNEVSLLVSDPRPVAAALMSLETSYGYPITYEDLAYVYPGDIKDVTEEVRRDLNKYKPGEAPRVLIPRGYTFNAKYRVSSDAKLEDPAEAIHSVLTATANNGNLFRFWQDGNTFHVVPAKIKNQAGNLVNAAPVLDASISIAEQDRNGIEMLQALCDAVSRVTNAKVIIGTIPSNVFYRSHSHRGAVNESARDVLRSSLANINNSLSWRLLYDPGWKTYALNVHLVPDVTSVMKKPKR